LWLGQVDLFLKSKKYKDAANKLDELSQKFTTDIDIWVRMAAIYSDACLNNAQKYHYALGNKAYLSGDYRAAITQYQMALQQNKNYDVNLNDVIEMRLLIAREMWQKQVEYGGA
jgi:predicted Zn-dependent protease